jgi:flagellin-like protein
MKKAISPMVATVLLIGFTIAVGALLSVWFTTFTRTQTATVSGAAGCASNPIDVKGLSLSGGILNYMVINSGTYSVNVTSVSFSCDAGSWTNSTLAQVISPGSSVVLTENTTNATATKNGCTNTNKVAINVLAKCVEVGGTTQAACPTGTCFS